MRLTASVAILMFLQTASASAQEGNRKIEMFPARKIFPAFVADGLAHGMSVGRVTDNREWTGNIGAALPLVQVEKSGMVFQIGAAATAFNRIIKTPGHITVYTIDYKVDFPLDLRIQSLAFRLALGHVSSHFADDGIEILHAHSISYVRDYLTIGVASDIPCLAGYLFLSGDWNYHFEPVSGPWILQAGGEGANVNLTSWARFYIAFNLKFRQNLAWGTTQAYQAGIRFFVKDHYTLRLAYTLQKGFDERGQLYDQKTTMNLIGLYVDF